MSIQNARATVRHRLQVGTGHACCIERVHAVYARATANVYKNQCDSVSDVMTVMTQGTGVFQPLPPGPRMSCCQPGQGTDHRQSGTGASRRSPFAPQHVRFGGSLVGVESGSAGCGVTGLSWLCPRSRCMPNVCLPCCLHVCLVYAVHPRPVPLQ